MFLLEQGGVCVLLFIWCFKCERDKGHSYQDTIEKSHGVGSLKSRPRPGLLRKQLDMGRHFHFRLFSLILCWKMSTEGSAFQRFLQHILEYHFNVFHASDIARTRIKLWLHAQFLHVRIAHVTIAF